MIVKNEADVLERCLKSISPVCDEIIIVDTGSTDNTKQIALDAGAKVYDFKWCDDFSKARNFSFSKAKSEYIIWLDADDVIENDNLEKIAALKERIEIENADAVYLKYNISFDSDGNPVFSFYRERIIRNCPLAHWVEPVHEVIVPFGKSIYSDAAVSHRKIKAPASGRNLKIMQKHLKKGGEFSPRLKYYYARELSYNGKADEAIEEYEKLLTEKTAWKENLIGACREAAVLYKNKGNFNRALELLFSSFIYDTPRAETLCDIGSIYFSQKQLLIAAYWYELALNIKSDDTSLAFIRPDCNAFIPSIQLCVIHDKLGNYKKAFEYNELAGSFKPNHPSYITNKAYFKTIDLI